MYVQEYGWDARFEALVAYLYERAGFVHAEPHHRFGQGVVRETWELKL